MATVRLATWNINSVRLRASLVKRFLKKHEPDVLCLQEIKSPNEFFPADLFAELGYRHQAVNGQKGYHGVATLSRLPLKRTDSFYFCDNPDSRHISVELECGLELHNFYVPAGGDIPDPKRNAKFAHKLSFLRELESHFRKHRKRRHAPIALVGDLNVAPLENDVWNHKQLLDVVSHTPIETELFSAARDVFEWCDVTRRFVPHDQKIYSWWSYRAQDWQASDRGRRLDHIWVSPALANSVTGHAILRQTRNWTQPSDHVPVLTTIEL